MKSSPKWFTDMVQEAYHESDRPSTLESYETLKVEMGNLHDALITAKAKPIIDVCCDIATLALMIASTKRAKK